MTGMMNIKGVIQMAKKGRISKKQLLAVLVAAAEQDVYPELSKQAAKVIDGYERGDILVLENEMPL
jgi:hypothetical protein